MADIKNIDIRKGMVFIGEDGHLYQCLDRDLNTPGNWRAILQLKVRNLKTLSITQNRVKPDDKVKLAYLDTRKMQYSVPGGGQLHLHGRRDVRSGAAQGRVRRRQDQVPEGERRGPRHHVTRASRSTSSSRARSSWRWSDTDPGIKGATAAAQTKPATLETGLVVQVPSFINKGDVVKIDTEEGKYIGRVAK